MEIFSATVGQELEIPMWFGTTTGLTVATLDAERVVDGIEALDLEDDLGGAFAEVSGIPGYYLLTLTPRRAGSLYVRLQEGSDINEFIIQSTLAVPPFVADPSLEGDYEFTVQVGQALIQGATVRVYNSAGTVLVARGTTDAQGLVVFALEAGDYQVRTNKVGYDFSSINPTSIVVLPNSNTSPRLDEVVPAAASIGDTITLLGQFFDAEESEVLFGDATPEPALFLDSHARVIVLEIPVGLTDLAVPIRVRKPDPNNPGEYLLSNVVTLERIP